MLVDLEPARQLARVELELRQGGLVGAPAIDSRCHRLAQLAVATKIVEQVALPALVEQALLVVLAVDLDERPGDVSEPGRRYSLVV